MKIIVCILVILSLALTVYAHVWQRIQVLRLGYLITEHEKRKEGLAKERRALWLELSQLESNGRAESLSMVEFSEELKVIELVNSD